MAAEMPDRFDWTDVETMALPPAGVTKVGAQTVSWDLFKKLPSYDIRNGAPEDITPILIRATIGISYHWVPIAGLPAAEANRCMDAFIRSHMHHLTVHRPTGWTDGQVRKAAIVLGTIRAAATTFYRLCPEDMIAGEYVKPYLAAHRAENGGVFYEARSDLSTAQRDAMLGELALNEQEQAVISTLSKCGAGVIPMQGYSLVMTNHHYLSDAGSQARKVYAVVEKAFWASQSFGSWFSDDMNLIQDLAWHKACHPVSMKFKLDMAMDLDMKDKLTNAGAGACASRLPAAETELRTANSYITLLNTVEPLFKMTGGSVDSRPLQTAYDLIKRIPPNVDNPMVDLAVPPSLARVVVDRKSGIKFLADLLRKNQDTVAYAYGFYCAQSDAMEMMSATPVTDTLKTSYSLAKLRNQSHASYVSGSAHYADYAAYRNRQRSEGLYTAPQLAIKP